MGVFYTDGGILVSQEVEWLQGALNALIGLFLRIKLAANISMSKKMTCQVVLMRSGISGKAFGRSITGKGETYREQLRRKTPFQTLEWRRQRAPCHITKNKYTE